jgi:hypothetical protein
VRKTGEKCPAGVFLKIIFQLLHEAANICIKQNRLAQAAGFFLSSAVFLILEK